METKKYVARADLLMGSHSFQERGHVLWGKGNSVKVGKYFSSEFLSVQWCKLAAASRGGMYPQGCYGYLSARPEGPPANPQGNKSQANLIAMSLKYRTLYSVNKPLLNHCWKNVLPYGTPVISIPLAATSVQIRNLTSPS